MNLYVLAATAGGDVSWHPRPGHRGGNTARLWTSEFHAVDVTRYVDELEAAGLIERLEPHRWGRGQVHITDAGIATLTAELDPPPPHLIGLSAR